MPTQLLLDALFTSDITMALCQCRGICTVAMLLTLPQVSPASQEGCFSAGTDPGAYPAFTPEPFCNPPFRLPPALLLWQHTAQVSGRRRPPHSQAGAVLLCHIHQGCSLVGKIPQWQGLCHIRRPYTHSSNCGDADIPCTAELAPWSCHVQASPQESHHLTFLFSFLWE